MATCAAVSMTTPEGATDEVLEIKNCATSSYRLANVISIAGQYTFSVWAKSASNLNVEFKVLGAVFTEAITTSWRKVVFTVDESTDTNIDISPAANTTLYLYKGMLQSGQYDTDWKPAPEDMATSEELSEQVSTVRSEITQTADAIRLEVTEVKKGVDEANAAIEALPGKINLSVSNGQLGSKASIKLSVDGTESTAEIDMTKARQAFANDTSSVTVSGGRVTFNSGTLLINAGNFTLDSGGTMTATNGNFTGKITATSGSIGGFYINSDGLYAGSGYNQTLIYPNEIRLMHEHQGRSYYTFLGGDNRGVRVQYAESETGDTAATVEPEGFYMSKRDSSGNYSGILSVTEEGFKKGEFLTPEIQHGNVSITPSAANTPTSKVVTFPKTFSATPDVVATINGTAPGTVQLGTAVSGATTRQVTIYITRTNTNATSVRWIAAN